jgi:hypothetical protein
MATDVPLLNAYKRPFVLRRLLQTLTGGFRLTSVPPSLVAAQIALFLVLPAVLVVVFVAGYAPIQVSTCTH